MAVRFEREIIEGDGSPVAFDGSIMPDVIVEYADDGKKITTRRIGGSPDE